ncbi:MAG: amidophosphoribosyltransferase [Planctomycetota bacterium]|nr:MAG: amidophosphoribosyltransferase [Planctomycetota bacterium]
MLDNAMRDECGIAVSAYLGHQAGGLETADPVDAARMIPGMLLDIQNRGQLAAGISTYNPERRQLLRTHKELGAVSEVFRLADKVAYAELMHRLAGPIAIGHTRYSTCGADDVSYAQPLERVHGKPFKWFSFCFNGNVANHQALAAKLVGDLGYHLTRPDSDTELFMHYLAFQQRGQRKTSWRKALGSISRVIDGAWSLALVTAEGDLVVARDPAGIKPLCYGFHDGYLVASSESIALQNLGVREIHDVEPGSALIIERGNLRIERFVPERRTAHCFFEWVYFANVASTLEGRSVYAARAQLGKALAEMETESITSDHIVVPVPDTSKAAGDAFAYTLHLPSIEGLVRNRYVGRTFIETEDRAAKVRRKFVALRGILQGRKVFLVDDSIVRSTTLAYLIDYMREEGGAAEVHVRIACPPIMGPCFYGIDMSTVGELFAPRFASKPTLRGELKAATRQAMADAIGADSLNYLPVDRVPQAIGLPRKSLCMACVTRKYPTPMGQELFAQAQSNQEAGIGGRTTLLSAP